MMTTLAILLWLGAQAADTWTTVVGLRSGRVRESNPIVRWVLQRTGTSGFIALKAAVTALGLLALAFDMPAWLLMLATLPVLDAAVHNYRKCRAIGACVLLLCLTPTAQAQDVYWQHPAAEQYFDEKPKRVADWEFWLALGLLQAATAADIESTADAVRDPSLGIVEDNDWMCGKRPGRACMYAVGTAVNAAFGVATYYLKKITTENGTKRDTARLWAWPLAIATAIRANAARENYRLLEAVKREQGK